MRLVFVGAVESSYYSLKTLLEGKAEVVRIVTLDKKYGGRHSDFADLTPLSEKFDVPISYINNINDPHILQELEALDPDYLLILGWSQLLKGPLLNLPKHGVIGTHPALLPKNRGRAALPWAILRGDTCGGSSLFFIDEGMDTGDIICQRKFEISFDETARTLYDKVTRAEQDMIADILPDLKRGTLPRIPQNHNLASYTAKRTARDGFIDWSRPARELWALIRAVSEPYPGAFTFYKRKRLIIWSAKLVESANYVGVPGQLLCERNGGYLVQCGEGHLVVQTVQEQGGEIMPATQFFNRIHDVLGIDHVALIESYLSSLS